MKASIGALLTLLLFSSTIHAGSSSSSEDDCLTFTIGIRAVLPIYRNGEVFFPPNPADLGIGDLLTSTAYSCDGTCDPDNSDPTNRIGSSHTMAQIQQGGPEDPTELFYMEQGVFKLTGQGGFAQGDIMFYGGVRNTGLENTAAVIGGTNAYQGATGDVTFGQIGVGPFMVPERTASFVVCLP